MARGPIAQGVMDIIRMIGRAIVGGGDAGSIGKTASKMSRAERKNQGAVETVRSERELHAGLGVVGGAALLVVAMFIFEARGGTNAPVAQPIDTLAVTDTAVLRTALFGAEPWVIECTGSSKGKSLLREAAAQRLLPDGLRAGSLDCKQALPGGASLLERFQLTAPSSPKAPPLLLLAGHGLRAPAPLGKQGSASSLVRHLKRWAAAATPLVNSTLDLRRHCLSRPTCLVLLTTGVAPSSAVKVVLKAVGGAHRELGVATINRKTHTASFTAQLPSTSRAVLIALRETSTSALAVEARAFKGVISTDNQLDVDAFISTASKAGGEGFLKLETPPRVEPEDLPNSGAGDLTRAELYDPLLSRKRYESETAL